MEKQEYENRLLEHEVKLKQLEVELKELELDGKKKKKSIAQLFSSVNASILVAIISATVSIATLIYQNYLRIEIEKAESETRINEEKKKFYYGIYQKLLEFSDPEKAEKFLIYYVKAGIIDDKNIAKLVNTPKGDSVELKTIFPTNAHIDTSRFGQALAYETAGFDFLIKNKIKDAAKNFKSAETIYPTYHNAYELSNYLNLVIKGGKDSLGLPEYNYILFNYTYKAPESKLKDLLRKVTLLENKKFLVNLYSYKVPDEKLFNAATYLKTNYLENNNINELAYRPNWLSNYNVVFFYSDVTREKARELARNLNKQTGDVFKISRGGGKGVLPNQKEIKFNIHYVSSFSQ